MSMPMVPLTSVRGGPFQNWSWSCPHCGVGHLGYEVDCGGCHAWMRLHTIVTMGDGMYGHIATMYKKISRVGLLMEDA